MRTLVDIPDQQIETLDRLARRQKRSRAAVVREALDEYLARNKAEPIDKFFGMWADRDIDGLEYQDKMRSEW
jgi:metal-responsive CopG/Arc/MetJ family transcriptional regulator